MNETNDINITRNGKVQYQICRAMNTMEVETCSQAAINSDAEKAIDYQVIKHIQHLSPFYRAQWLLEKRAMNSWYQTSN